MKETIEKDKEIFKIEKYPENITHEQKIIMDIYVKYQKGLAFSTFQREFFKKSFGSYDKFIEMLQDLSKKCEDQKYPLDFCLYKEQSEVLKFGTSKDKDKSKKVINESK